MKFEKAIIALYSIVLLAILIFLMAISLDPYYFQLFSYYFLSDAGKIVTIILGALLILLVLKILIGALKKDEPTLASIQTTELGEVNITVAALEHLVSKAAKQIKEVKEIKPKVKPLTNGITVRLNAVVNPESNLPIVTRELQETVKGYIEQIAGIDVLQVKVVVNYNTQENRVRVE